MSSSVVVIDFSLDKSPRLNIPYMVASQSQKELTHNLMINMLELLLQSSVKDILNTPPSSPVEGDMYLIGDSPSDDWANYARYLAGYLGGVWNVIAPVAGYSVFVQDEVCFYAFEGGEWIKKSDVPGINWQGTYNASTAYIKNDGVMYDGAAWYCLTACTGQTPVEGTYWTKIVSKGDPGSVWYSGSGAPSSGTGIDGDYYLDTATYEIYKKIGGAWSDTGINIKGIKGDTGAIGINWMGAYNASTTYSVRDAVSYNGSSWYCKQACSGQTPAEGDYWTLLVSKGDVGPGVPSGGSTGQVLAKKSATDYDTEWINAGSGGGGGDWSDITDKPSNITDIAALTLTGNGGKAVVVNTGGTALELGTVSGDGASSFSALSDFSIDLLADGDSPQYDAVRGSWVNKPSDGSERVATPHKSWRIWGVAGGGIWFRVQELQFRSSIGVPETPSGGTPIASSEYPGQGAGNAFDGDTGTQWACAVYGTAGQWIGYTFAEAKAVSEVAIRQSTGLSDFNLEYADDDGIWHVYTSYTSLGAWENVLTAFRAIDPAQGAKYLKALINNPAAGQIVKYDGGNWVNDDEYAHPTGDGNMHVPATGTSSNGKVLMAGATAGSMSWEIPGSSVDTTFVYGHKIDIPPAIPDAMDDEFDGTSLDNKWTVISQYTNTLTLTDSHLVIDTPLSARTRVLGILQTAPSGNWKIRAKVSIDSLVWNYYGVGLMARVSSTDKRIWAGIMAHASYGCMSGYVQRLNVESIASETDLCNFVNHDCYFEMEYDGTNIIWRISVSGVAFREVYREAVSSFLGSAPDQIGIAVHPWDETGNGWGGLSSWDWFRRIS